MKPRYFKLHASIWKFMPDGSGLMRAETHAEWTESICGIEDMADATAIDAEEGEP